MKWFLIAQTVLNLFAAVGGKDALGRLACLGFGLWGSYYLVTQYWS